MSTLKPTRDTRAHLTRVTSLPVHQAGTFATTTEGEPDEYITLQAIPGRAVQPTGAGGMFQQRYLAHVLIRNHPDSAGRAADLADAITSDPAIQSEYDLTPGVALGGDAHGYQRVRIELAHTRSL